MSHIPMVAQRIVIPQAVEVAQIVVLDQAQDLDSSTVTTHLHQEEILVEIPEARLITTQAAEAHLVATQVEEETVALPHQIYQQVMPSMTLSKPSICVSQSSIHISTKAP